MGDCSIFMIRATEKMVAADPELASSFAEMVIVTEEIIASRSQATEGVRPRLVPVDYDPFVEVPRAADEVAAAVCMREIDTGMVNEMVRDQLRESLLKIPWVLSKQ